MSATRCCAICRTPWDICGWKTCKCHGSALSSEDAQITSILDYLEGR